MWAVENMNSNRFVAGAGLQSFGQVNIFHENREISILTMKKKQQG
jgi:hypothetical protein